MKKQRRKSAIRLRIIKIVLVVSALLIVATVGVVGYMLRDLPSPSSLQSLDNFAVSTQILDRNGQLLYEIFADENRTPVQLSELPPHVYQASIAIEDKSFYHHWGFDFVGMIRAIRNTLFRQSLQGGSTITQQLIKNALLTRERTVERKMKEAVLTVAAEVLYSKDEILEMYLNHIPYGGTAWGIEAAAKRYFNKSAKDLTVAEAALLAGLPQAPSKYSPFQSDPRNAKNRQLDVLRRMREDGYITAEQEEQAKNEELHFALSQTNIRAPHFVFYVKDLLVQKYGIDRVERGGLRVKTTLDLEIQQAAQASLSAEIKKIERMNVSNGAALVVRPPTGEILAMIGSKDYFDATIDGKVNVTIEERQPGSSFKPLNLAIAFELRKQTPASMLLDIPTCFEQPGSSPYCPKNYDSSFRGPVQQRFALGNSYNIPAVKTAALNGVETLVASASALGITTWQDPTKYGISLGLGAGEVRMTEFAEAYSALANQGVKVPLNPILEVSDFQGNVLEENDPEEKRADLKEMTEDEDIISIDEMKRIFHRAPAYLISHILLDNNARSGAFGANSQLQIKNQVISVKTGTTNNLRDNWTIGYTPEVMTAVWVGNNSGESMNRNLVSGVTGAAPIWNDIMSYLLQNQEAIWPEKPDDVISTSVCSLTGGLPTAEDACATRNEFFWRGTEPTESIPVQKETWIDPTTGIPPKAGESWEGLNLQLETKSLLSDPFTENYCLDCVRPVNEQGQTQYERAFVTQQKLIELARYHLNLKPANQTQQTEIPQ